MEQNIISKAVLVKKRMEEDFNNMNERGLEIFFDKFINDKRNRTEEFIRYYIINLIREVLSKNRFSYIRVNELSDNFHEL